MFETNNSNLVEDLLLKLSLCPQNKQSQIFEEYINILPKYLINQVKNFLINRHPFISDELNEMLNKSTSSDKFALENKSNDKLDNNINLSLLRIKAKKDQSKKIIVLCQPKSGSTFLTNLIAKSLNLDTQNLNTFAYSPTNFGINGRNQELCELALTKSIFNTSKKGGFVAQHHIKANMFLINQINYFKFKPIILTRNVFDSLISLDDHIMSGHRDAKEKKYPHFLTDGDEIVPQNYMEFDFEKRLDFLTKFYGTWYVQFYLTWKRMANAVNDGVCWITYENAILNKKNLEINISNFLNLNKSEISNLGHIFNDPKSIHTRFNKGVSGRGKKIKDESKTFLKNYAEYFSEFDKNDFINLFGNQ